MYKITITKKAQDDLDWFRKNDKSSYIKCFDLTRELIDNPRVGTEQRHEDSLCFCAFIRTVLLRDFSDEDGFSHLLFCVIIVGVHFQMFQESEIWGTFISISITDDKGLHFSQIDG